MNLITDLERLHELQSQYMGVVDMQIETRKDQSCTMVTFCGYTSRFERTSDLYIYKFYWSRDNSNKFKHMENELEFLRINYLSKV